MNPCNANKAQGRVDVNAQLSSQYKAIGHSRLFSIYKNLVGRTGFIVFKMDLYDSWRRFLLVVCGLML